MLGEDFKGFPAIIVNRQLLEKKKYNKNESLELSFYLIGTATQYVDFISEYLDTTNKLWNNFFQKRLMKVEYLDDTELYNGKLKSETLLTDMNEIPLCLCYYNEKYNCQYIIPDTKIVLEGSYIRDFNYYQINLKRFYFNGFKMIIEVKNYPAIFMRIGIGKNAFLGGGKFNEN